MWIYSSLVGDTQAYPGGTICWPWGENQISQALVPMALLVKGYEERGSVTGNQNGESGQAGEVHQGWAVLTGQAPGRRCPFNFQEYKGRAMPLSKKKLRVFLVEDRDRASWGEMYRRQIHWFNQIQGGQLLHSIILICRKMQLPVLASFKRGLNKLQHKDEQNKGKL